MDHPLTIIVLLWAGSASTYWLFRHMGVSKLGPITGILLFLCCFAFAAVYYVLAVPIFALAGWVVDKLRKTRDG